MRDRRKAVFVLGGAVMPMLLKNCFKCRFFRTIFCVHPESIAATKEQMLPGWYLCCQRNIKLDETIKPVKGFPWIDHQVLRQFAALNGAVSVKCPLDVSPRPLQGALFRCEDLEQGHQKAD